MLENRCYHGYFVRTPNREVVRSFYPSIRCRLFQQSTLSFFLGLIQKIPCGTSSLSEHIGAPASEMVTPGQSQLANILKKKRKGKNATKARQKENDVEDEQRERKDLPEKKKEVERFRKQKYNTRIEIAWILKDVGWEFLEKVSSVLQPKMKNTLKIGFKSKSQLSADNRFHFEICVENDTRSHIHHNEGKKARIF